MANFFIRRPIFAWVLAIILMMAGALAILQLPVAQYPTIAPPAVSVSANYPGADAQTVQDTVTQVIEQNMNGIDNLMYMSSTSDSAGSVTITLTFQSGTDPDIAQVQVQNKLQLATPLLPQEVQQQGISVEKSSSSYLMDGFVIPFNMPAIVELGTATGFDFELIDQAGLGHDALTQARNQLLGMAAQHPASLVSVRPNGLEDTAQFKLEVDQEKAQALGVSLSDINQTISTALGGTYVNDFIDRGRVKKVYVQADAKFRMLPEDVDKLYVRSANGEMVPFSAFTTAHWVYGSPRLERYNGLPSMEIQGEAAPGTSSGDAMALMENLASQLPAGIGYDWTGMSYQERLSGNQAPALVAISFVVVFLCLAALYESWSIPVSVMLVVPLGIVGVLLAATLFNQKNDVYFMVGLLTTIGLSAKNAILIVEFAKDLMEKEGKGVVEATLMAVRMRLRPILMTSLAFILGVLPLAISNGAGSGAQNAVGIGVMGGMVSATLLAIFFVPVFFVVIRRCFKG